MRIKEFAIWKYGPLSGSARVEPGNFTLFYGPNEQGKTLTIDALVKLLLKKGYKEFEKNINRVSEEPEGYVIIEGEGGETVKFPEAGDLTRVTGLTASECRNIFIIRDSDLSINREGEFYKGVTNRLTGLQTEEIGRIKAGIRDLARLTPGNDFQDKIPHRLKSNLARAARLVERIGELKETLVGEGFDRFETELVQADNRIEKTERDVKRYEEARRQGIYRKGWEALQSLKEANQEAVSLREFNRGDLESWQSQQTRVESLQKDEKALGEKIDLAREELQLARQELKRIDRAVEEMERTAANFSEQVEPMLKDHDHYSRQLAGQETLKLNLLTRPGLAFAAVLLLLSLIGAMIRPYWWFNLISAGSLFFLLLLGGIRLIAVRTKVRRAALWQEIHVKAAALGALAEDPGELLLWWGEFKNRLTAERSYQNEEKNKVVLQEKLAEGYKGDLNSLTGEIKQIEENLGRLRGEIGVSSPGEYRVKLELKLGFENRVQKERAVLESHFGGLTENLPLPDQIVKWKNSLENLKPFSGLAEGLTYNEKELLDLKEKLEELRQKRGGLTDRWAGYRGQMEEIEKEANQILCDETEPLYGQTLADLETIGDKLAAWIGCWEDNRQWAMAALELFDQLAAEEERKVLELFGEESPISRYFYEITGGRYKEVLFDRDQCKIAVSPDGQPALWADQLSGGAYDQLYFSIRLALGEKLLMGETGLFILDDPFVKADPERLKRLFDMLAKVAASGWQVLYFSAKGEVRELLEDRMPSVQIVDCGQCFPAVF